MKKNSIKAITFVCAVIFGTCSGYTSKNKPVRYKHSQDIHGNEGFAYFIEKDIRVVHFPCNNKYEGKKTVGKPGSLKRIDMTTQEAQEKYHELAALYDKQGKRHRECLL